MRAWLSIPRRRALKKNCHRQRQLVSSEAVTMVREEVTWGRWFRLIGRAAIYPTIPLVRVSVDLVFRALVWRPHPLHGPCRGAGVVVARLHRRGAGLSRL